MEKVRALSVETKKKISESTKNRQSNNPNKKEVYKLDVQFKIIDKYESRSSAEKSYFMKSAIKTSVERNMKAKSLGEIYFHRDSAFIYKKDFDNNISQSTIETII